ncbi:unnamed protein product [Peronospora belbahrii]|uniref:Uncharacterized protein n=1 Tax=Peronospora belbahrii TaxID=622444 RepID=A0AAU9KUV3_9STRA|nr:unnamed protein product [Peronospora belbahrii]
MVFFQRQFNCRFTFSGRTVEGNTGHWRYSARSLVLRDSMIFGWDMPLSFWGDDAEYAVYILNRSPSKANLGRQ